MKRSFSLILFSIISLHLFAQKEANWWYFGTRAGLSFASGSPVAVTNANNLSDALEGVASISNSKGGLLFYTDGNYVFNKKHNTMTNGTGLNGDNSSTQSAVIVQQPVRSNRYFIFTVDLEWQNKGFCYSIVDTALNGGDGQVIVKNVQLLTKCAEKVNAVKHANKVDTWVVTHGADDNKFYCYKLSAIGISSSATVSSVGPVHSTSNMGYSKGYMKFSADGTKLVVAVAGNQLGPGGGYQFNSPATGRIEIYDFDNLTGVISNPQIIDNSNTNIPSGVGKVSGPYGVEFSPNGRYVYISFYIPATGGNTGNDGVWQIDMFKKTADSMAASIFHVAKGTAGNYGGMQLAPDGKIYVARNGRTYVSSITKPNCPKSACTFVDNAVSLSGRTCRYGIPTFIQTFFNKAEFDWGSNAANLCENALTKLFVIDSAGVDSVRWKFDDPSTGSKNTAKGFTAYHKFSSPKSYSVFVQLYRKVTSADCYADTLRKRVTIFPNPKPKLGNDTVICAGEEVILFDNTPNATFIWKDGSAVPAYIAKTKGWHWIDVKVGGCTGRDSMYLDVISFPDSSFVDDTLIICKYDSVKLTASVGQKYIWSLGDTVRSVYAKKQGNVWVGVANGSCYAYDTIFIKVRNLPTLFVGNDTILCQGDSVILKAKTTSTTKIFQWSNSSTDSVLKVKTTGIYWATVKDTMCTSLRDSVRVTVQNKLTLNLGKDTFICKGGSYLINAPVTGGVSWLWHDNTKATTFLAKTAGKKYVKVTSAACEVSDTINIGEISLPPFSLGRDTILCVGATYDIIQAPVAGVEFTWMGTVKNYSYPIKTTGKYYVDLRDLPKKVCKSSDTVLVTFNPGTKINLGNDTLLCVGQTTNLNAAKYAFKSYRWWDGATTPGIRASATPPAGIHWLEGNDGICVTRDSIKITYRPELFIPSLGPDLQLCDNATKDLDITAANATLYDWRTLTGMPLAFTAKYTVNNPGGTFCGTISDGFCWKRDTITITYKTTPIVNLGLDIDVCDGALPTLNASSAAAEAYIWSTGATTSSIVAVNMPKTVYWVDASNGNCVKRDDIMVSFSIPPVLDFGFTDSVFCEAPNLNYDFSFWAANTTFTWQDGYNLPTRKIKLPGSYWVAAQNACGTDTARVNIKVDELGCRLYFPTAFSPNGDGINDFWKPQGQVIEWVELVIYDRWGEIIYKGDPIKGWDGAVRDKIVPDGVYPAIISYRQASGGYPRLFVKSFLITILK